MGRSLAVDSFRDFVETILPVFVPAMTRPAPRGPQSLRYAGCETEPNVSHDAARVLSFDMVAAAEAHGLRR